MSFGSIGGASSAPQPSINERAPARQFPYTSVTLPTDGTPVTTNVNYPLLRSGNSWVGFLWYANHNAPIDPIGSEWSYAVTVGGRTYVVDYKRLGPGPECTTSFVNTIFAVSGDNPLITMSVGHLSGPSGVHMYGPGSFIYLTDQGPR